MDKVPPPEVELQLAAERHEWRTLLKHIAPKAQLNDDMTMGSVNKEDALETITGLAFYGFSQTKMLESKINYLISMIEDLHDKR